MALDRLESPTIREMTSHQHGRHRGTARTRRVWRDEDVIDFLDDAEDPLITRRISSHDVKRFAKRCEDFQGRKSFVDMRKRAAVCTAGRQALVPVPSVDASDDALEGATLCAVLETVTRSEASVESLDVRWCVGAGALRMANMT